MAWNISHPRKSWESWGSCSLEKGRLLCLYIYMYVLRSFIYLLMCRNTWRHKKGIARFFPMVPSDRPRGNGLNLKHGRFHLNIRKLFSTMRITEHCSRFPRNFMESNSSLQILKKSGYGPEHPILGGPAWARQMDKITSRGPFQPQPWCDSVKTEEKLQLLGQNQFLFSEENSGCSYSDFRDFTVCDIHYSFKYMFLNYSVWAPILVSSILEWI